MNRIPNFFLLNLIFFSLVDTKNLEWTSNSGCYRSCLFDKLTYFDLPSYSDNAFLVANLKTSEYLMSEKYETGEIYVNIIDKGNTFKKKMKCKCWFLIDIANLFCDMIDTTNKIYEGIQLRNEGDFTFSGGYDKTIMKCNNSINVPINAEDNYYISQKINDYNENENEEKNKEYNNNKNENNNENSIDINNEKSIIENIDNDNNKKDNDKNDNNNQSDDKNNQSDDKNLLVEGDMDEENENKDQKKNVNKKNKSKLQNATLISGIGCFGLALTGIGFLSFNKIFGGKSSKGTNIEESPSEELKLEKNKTKKETEKCSCSCCNTKFILIGTIVTAACGTILTVTKETYIDKLETKVDNNEIKELNEYNLESAIDYALLYCDETKYNPQFNNYKNKGGDCANFVSQCLVSAGFDLSGCSGKDEKGMITSVVNLMQCLDKKGWKKSSGPIPKEFKAGYPIFINNQNTRHAMISTSIEGSKIIYAGHTVDRCNGEIKTPSNNLIYYYLPEKKI